MNSDSNTNDEPMVSQLSFDNFITILKEDVNFNTEQDVIVHIGKSFKMDITNQRQWKAAMQELFNERVDSFNFRIQSCIVKCDHD